MTGRLTQTDKNSSTVATYGYDDNSNRNSGTIGGQATTATYDDQDRMTAYNVLTFTYNANGELTSKTNTLLSTTTNYTYDVFGNLTSVTLPSANVITYEIDGLNRRIGKKLNGTLQKRWVYMDQTRIAAELDAAGNIAKRFIYASKSNIPDYMVMGGVNYRIISDHLGSPRLVIKVSDGTVTGMMDHDEYGRVAVDTNPGLLPFGFAGGLYDADTGLVRFGARDFDAETGRWTAKDPILFGGGDANLYGYTFQDPVNFIDPSGLKFEFRDATSQRIFNNLLNSPALSRGNRAMLDGLERSSSTISIGQGAASNRPAMGTAMGLTEGFKGNTNSEVTLWFSGSGNMELSILLHELTHADQILRDEPVTEGPAYKAGGDFLGRCK